MRRGGSQFAQAQRTGHSEREPDDFYPTWPPATEALLRAETFDGPIWEPACGDGALQHAGHRAVPA